ncbi:MFS family permease [Brevundimonas bullata]|uniref:MFS family permease n=1 Tax=Brevundimonas bullata TaxID=13160 RepID=A0A7W7IS44_9CAUL|nr:hypothetical protein [Brevundimonas bullata]MBB4799529.1 MFS family permease [Brevundimonas bullata]MBB6384400.1 MFS family permease [Brevundimonas bullata]
MTFPATDCAFEGFRLTRRAPVAVLSWAAAYAVFIAILFLLVGPHFVTVLSVITEMQAQGQTEPSPEDVERLMQAYGVIIGWAMPLGLLFSALISTAIVRSVIRPDERKFGYLRVGKDELRVLGASLIVSLIMFGVTLAGFMIVTVAMAGAMALPALWLVVVLLSLGVIALLAWLSVRLSLVVPSTFAEGRIVLKSAFAMTGKKVFWPLLGMAIIAGVMAMLVGLLGSAVAAPLSLMVGGNERLIAMEGASVPSLLSALGPMLAVSLVVQAVLSAAQVAIMYAPFSAAYLQLKGAPRP